MRKALLVLTTACVAASCSETPPPAPPAPAPAVEAPEPPPVPIAVEAPRAAGNLTFIAGRCDKPHGFDAGKFEEIKAEPLKIGAIPERLQVGALADLKRKTRVWQLESQGLDFYKILSDGNPNGLKFDVPAAACIRYSLYRPGSAELYSEMLFSVSYNPKKPEILTIMPARIYFRDFQALADQPGATQAAVKVTLGLRTFSLERTSGRAAASMQNQEMAVELIDNPGPGKAIDRLYDPVSGPTATIPLPPWDYSPASVNPRHNLSIFGITVTEIADFGWLERNINTLWPSWEYEATDISKIKIAARFYAETHKGKL